jgi:hypothetical protein
MSENHRIFLLIGNSKLGISDPETSRRSLPGASTGKFVVVSSRLDAGGPQERA